MSIIANINNFIKIASSSANNKPMLILKEALNANMCLKTMIDSTNKFLVDYKKNTVIDMDDEYDGLVQHMEYALDEEDKEDPDSLEVVREEAIEAVDEWLLAFAIANCDNFNEVVNDLIAEAQQK